MTLSGEGQLLASAVKNRLKHEGLAHDLQAPQNRRLLEGDVVVGDAHVAVVGRIGGSALIVAGAGGFGVTAAGGAFAAGLAAEQSEFVAEDLGLVFLFATGLVVPGARLDLAFDEELSAFFYVVADDL